MKRKSIFFISLLTAFAIILSSCADKEDEAVSEPAESSEAVLSQKREEDEPEQYEPSSDEIKNYSRKWAHSEISEGEERIYNLILSEDGFAQLAVQNLTGELSELYGGSWNLSDKAKIELSLKKDMEEGKLLEAPSDILNGTYSAKISDNSLSLKAEEGSFKIIESSEKEIIFLDADYFQSKGEIICHAVLSYYKAQNGEDYPGFAEIDSISEEGFSVHLYEDMGDHTATAGRFLVDPVTFAGIDEIMGTEIDFAPYLN